MAGTMVHRPIKYINGPWGKQMCLKEPGERNSKPMDVMWCRKVRMGHNKLEVMK